MSSATPKITPHFRNPSGYVLRMVPGSNELFEFTIDLMFPLTWVDSDGREWQPDRHYKTDRGSIPNLVSRLPGFARNRLSYLMHDSAYTDDGSGHGLYVRVGDVGPFTFCRLTRSDADEMMRRMLLSEGVRPAVARTIWAAVRVFGRRW